MRNVRWGWIALAAFVAELVGGSQGSASPANGAC